MFISCIAWIAACGGNRYAITIVFVFEGIDVSMEKEAYANMEEDFYTSNSSGSHDQVECDVNGGDRDAILKIRVGPPSTVDEGQMTTSIISMDSLKTMTPAAFGIQFQEVIICALMQSSSSLVGPSPTV